MHMVRKAITSLMIEIKKILEKERQLSIRQIALKTKSQWRTVEKALETMKKLGVLEEEYNSPYGKKEERLFSIK